MAATTCQLRRVGVGLVFFRVKSGIMVNKKSRNRDETDGENKEGCIIHGSTDIFSRGQRSNTKHLLAQPKARTANVAANARTERHVAMRRPMNAMKAHSTVVVPHEFRVVGILL
jgi:hypothetical protein